MENKHALWHDERIVLRFNTDNEILHYLNDNGVKYKILSSSRGKYIMFEDLEYFIMPDLLYFLQGEYSE